jgi:hypothetical protein
VQANSSAWKVLNITGINPHPAAPARAGPSVFRGQENGVVGEMALDFVDRKICVLVVLRIDDVIAVVANKACGPVFPHREFPYLEFFI